MKSVKNSLDFIENQVVDGDFNQISVPIRRLVNDPLLDLEKMLFYGIWWNVTDEIELKVEHEIG